MVVVVCRRRWFMFRAGIGCRRLPVSSPGRSRLGWSARRILLRRIRICQICLILSFLKLLLTSHHRYKLIKVLALRALSIQNFKISKSRRRVRSFLREIKILKILK